MSYYLPRPTLSAFNNLLIHQLEAQTTPMTSRLYDACCFVLSPKKDVDKRVLAITLFNFLHGMSYVLVQKNFKSALKVYVIKELATSITAVGALYLVNSKLLHIFISTFTSHKLSKKVFSLETHKDHKNINSCFELIIINLMIAYSQNYLENHFSKKM